MKGVPPMAGFNDLAAKIPNNPSFVGDGMSETLASSPASNFSRAFWTAPGHGIAGIFGDVTTCNPCHGSAE